MDASKMHEVRRMLQMVHPQMPTPSLSPSPQTSSGVDCLAVVVRHIISHLTDELLRSLAPQMNAGEALIKYFFADLSSENAHSQRETLVNNLAASSETNDALSFRHLAEGPTMLRYLWKLHTFHLFNSYCKQQGEDGWTALRGEDYDLEIAAQSIVEYDGHDTLAETILRRFGEDVSAETGSRFAWTWHAPSLLRVLFKPSSQRATWFRDLYKFALEVPLHERESEDDAEGWDAQVDEYHLIAVVRMRKDATGADCVRTFATDGGAVLPPAETRFAGQTWRMGNEDGVEYMLYYLKIFEPAIDDEFIPEETQIPAGNIARNEELFNALYRKGLEDSQRALSSQHGPSETQHPPTKRFDLDAQREKRMLEMEEMGRSPKRARPYQDRDPSGRPNDRAFGMPFNWEQAHSSREGPFHPGLQDGSQSPNFSRSFYGESPTRQDPQRARVPLEPQLQDGSQGPNFSKPFYGESPTRQDPQRARVPLEPQPSTLHGYESERRGGGRGRGPGRTRGTWQGRGGQHRGGTGSSHAASGGDSSGQLNWAHWVGPGTEE